MSLLPRKSKIKAEVKGAGAQARRARDVANFLGDNESARNVANDAELIYKEAAPKRSHRLARGIKAVGHGDEVFVRAVAVDPKTGFDYVAVSRFGHRKDFIVPVSKSGQPRQSRTVRRDPTGRFVTRGAPALVFSSRGSTWKLSQVRGFRPKGDWVDKAWPAVKEAADTELDRVGTEITVRWST